MDDLSRALREAALERLSEQVHSTDPTERVFALSLMQLVEHDDKQNDLVETLIEFATTVRYAAEDAGYDVEQPPDSHRIRAEEALRRISRALAILSRYADQRGVGVFSDGVDFRVPSQGEQAVREDEEAMGQPEKPSQAEIAGSLPGWALPGTEQRVPCTCGSKSMDVRHHLSDCAWRQAYMGVATS